VGESALSTGMQLACFPVNPITVLADSSVLTAMALLRRHKFDSTVSLVVRVDERGDPLASMVFAVELVAPVIGPYFAVRKSNSE
jgi:CBS domain-containing protein